MNRSELLTKLKTHFNDSELREICFELEKPNYEDLEGVGRAAKARELILYLERDERLLELLKICQRLRPNVAWISSSTEPSNPNENSDSIRVQISNLSQRLNKLREIKARKGIDTDPHYLIEIDNIEKELNQLVELRKNV